MGIAVNIHPTHGTVKPAVDIHISGEDSLHHFKELVQRATNLWPDATAEIKSFADILLTGRPLQDYHSQAKDIHDARQFYAHIHLCTKCGHTTTLKTRFQNPPDYPVTCENEVQVSWLDKDQKIQERWVKCRTTIPFNPPKPITQ